MSFSLCRFGSMHEAASFQFILSRFTFIPSVLTLLCLVWCDRVVLINTIKCNAKWRKGGREEEGGRRKEGGGRRRRKDGGRRKKKMKEVKL